VQIGIRPQTLKVVGGIKIACYADEERRRFMKQEPVDDAMRNDNDGWVLSSELQCDTNSKCRGGLADIAQAKRRSAFESDDHIVMNDMDMDATHGPCGRAREIPLHRLDSVGPLLAEYLRKASAAVDVALEGVDLDTVRQHRQIMAARGQVWGTRRTMAHATLHPRSEC
jgi:hypothetical protein